jgi:hypothetical protein
MPPILESLSGYLSLLISWCVLLLASFHWQPDSSRKTIRRQTNVLLYSNLSAFLFLLASPILSVILEGDPSRRFFDLPFQTALSVLALTALVEWLTLRFIPLDLFGRTSVNGIIHFCGLAVALTFVGNGIINIVWFLVLTLAHAGYLLVSDLYATMSLVIEGAADCQDTELTREVLSDIRSEFNHFMKLAVQGLLALGASLGVSMTILFREGKVAWDSPEHQNNAARMVVGFAVVAVGLFFWVGRPYLQSFMSVREHYARVVGEDKKIILLSGE